MLVLVYQGRGVPYYAVPEVGGGGGCVCPLNTSIYTCILWAETTLAFVVWEMVHAPFIQPLARTAISVNKQHCRYDKRSTHDSLATFGSDQMIVDNGAQPARCTVAHSLCHKFLNQLFYWCIRQVWPQIRCGVHWKIIKVVH